VFAGAAGLAVLSVFVASFVRVPRVRLRTPIVVTEEEGPGTCRTEEIGRTSA